MSGKGRRGDRAAVECVLKRRGEGEEYVLYLYFFHILDNSLL